MNTSQSGVLPGALVLVTGASGYVGGRLVTVLYSFDPVREQESYA